jgi:hypothetical protein
MTAPADNTPISILTDAYYDAGLLPQGESLSAEQLVLGMRKLTELINFLQTRPGVKLWLNQDLSVTLIAGQADYTFGPAAGIVMSKPLKVIDAFYTNASGIRRPLLPMSWSDHNRLSQVTQTGQLNQYFVDKQPAQLKVSFWLVPDAVAATGTAHLQILRQVTNFVNVTETMDFPIEWRLALHWGVADMLCTGQPQAIMDRCQARAELYAMSLEDFDVEDAPVNFAPDSRGLAVGAFQ